MTMTLEQIYASVVVKTTPASGAFQQTLFEAINSLYASATGRSFLIRAARGGLLVFTTMRAEPPESTKSATQ